MRSAPRTPVELELILCDSVQPEPADAAPDAALHALRSQLPAWAASEFVTASPPHSVRGP